ncbi:hypothetical protein MIND_00594100 [Mycena indigotica]|uniref:F-box domain-containing protein n=1 Tax=Mycena indigotica TaxID=2126181 RepID=A0A8H6W3I9_9AGAR|nr:uncharacterized protein MIND_00594100 [Mycena indigotica]KAF7303647.1 hypothetical protein MIND_00594100 [Mycena indigotica]
MPTLRLEANSEGGTTGHRHPLERLPVEIWTMIFVHSLPPTGCDIKQATILPLHLSSVCNTFRAMAQTIPQLWASFSLKSLDSGVKNKERLEGWIRHSRGRIVALHIQGPLTRKSTLGFVLPHIQHLEYLEIDGGPPANSFPAMQLHRLLRDASLLRHVSLANFPDAWSPDHDKWTRRVDPFSCQLHAMCLNGSVSSWGLSHLLDFRSLESLSCLVEDDWDAHQAMDFILLITEFWKCQLSHLKLATPGGNHAHPWYLCNMSSLLNSLASLTHLEFSSPSVSIDHIALLTALAGNQMYMWPRNRLPCPQLATLDLTLAVPLHELAARQLQDWCTALFAMLSVRYQGARESPLRYLRLGYTPSSKTLPVQALQRLWAYTMLKNWALAITVNSVNVASLYHVKLQ